MQFSGYLRYVLAFAFKKLKKKIVGMLIRAFAIITHKTPFAIIRALRSNTGINPIKNKFFGQVLKTKD